jgi:trimethylamine--corrinoid protein Co-methyltransferase
MKQVELTTLKPSLRLLQKEHCKHIHSASMEILSYHGIQMLDPEGRDLLLGAGAIAKEENWIIIPSVLVKQALGTAPGRIVLANQKGERTLFLEDTNIYFGPGSDTVFTDDIDTGERRETVRSDVGRMAKLCDALSNIDFVMSMGIPRDVPSTATYLYEFSEMVKNSNKPIVFTADAPQDIDDIYEMACAVAGGPEHLQENPFLLHYAEPISPLLFPIEPVQRLIRCAQYRLPVGMIPAANAGAGSPITNAGSIAQANAECLAGLVIHQLKSPGAPFLYGFNIATLDMKHGVVSYGAPEFRITDGALADLARFYGLPSWGTSGCSDSKVVDAQAGIEATFAIYNSMLSGNNLIHDVGYIQSGLTSSMEMIIMADEIVDMCRRFIEPIAFNKNTIPMDAYGRAKSTRSFVADHHTYENFKQAQWTPKRLDRARFDVWEKRGKKDLYARLNDEAREILSKHVPEAKPAEVMAKIDHILEKRS